MNIKEFYGSIGEDFNDVIGRLRAESRVCKYVLKFPQFNERKKLCGSFQGGAYY